MEAPATEPRLAADQHDVVLALALGAVCAAERFADRVSRASPASEPLDAGDPVVLASLGVLALARALRRWLEESAGSAPPPSQPCSAGDPLASRELLR